MALVRLPYVFTQDSLLTADEFTRAAERNGHKLGSDRLGELSASGALQPFYAIVNDDDPARALPLTDESLGLNPRGHVMHAALEGRLYDGADSPEGAVAVVYGSWQLDTLGVALRDLRHPELGDALVARAARRRQTAVALHALASLHMPQILGRMTLPAGLAEDGFHDSNTAVLETERLALADLDAAELEPIAADMLLSAWDDPNIELWPLLRHARHAAWAKLRGRSRECVWSRIGAEILLRSHEELAAVGELPALAALPKHVRTPMNDRISVAGSTGPSLDAALASLGLSPHPKVLLLVEGQTEMLHVPRLLALFGLDHPSQVRVQNCRGSKVNPSLLSRYAITPQLTEPGGPTLDRHPTALIVAMDPENDWRTPEGCAEQRRKLQNAVREEVTEQGGTIDQDELDFLVTVTTWPEKTYELANFDIGELTDALWTIASSRKSNRLERPDIEQVVRDTQVAAEDISAAFKALQLREDKPRLAELLWPALRRRCEHELATGSVTTPVLGLVLSVREKVAANSHRSYQLKA